MKLDLLKTTGRKLYRIEKTKEAYMLEEKTKKKEEFILKVETELFGTEKIIVNFEIMKLLYSDNYIIEQKFYNLLRNRKVIFDLNGNYIDTLNKKEILEEWGKFSKLIKKEIENANKKTEKELEMMGEFLIHEKNITNSCDIFSIFFPKIYNKEFKSEIHYNDSLQYFFGPVDIPVKVRFQIDSLNDSIKVSSNHEIDEVYFRKYEIKEVFEYNKIKVDYNKNIIKSNFRYDMLLDRENHILRKGEVELGGEIKNIYKNYTKLQIEEMV